MASSLPQLLRPAPAGEPAPGAPSEADIELAGRLGQALARLVRALVRARSHALSGDRSDVAAIPLLVALTEHGPMRMTALAEAVFSDPSTVSRQVAHLAGLGYVERRPDSSDRRACVLALAPAGEEALRRHRRTRDEYLAHLLSDWSERDRRRVATLVDRLATDVVDHLHQAPETAPGRRAARQLEETT